MGVRKSPGLPSTPPSPLSKAVGGDAGDPAGAEDDDVEAPALHVGLDVADELVAGGRAAAPVRVRPGTGGQALRVTE